MSDGTKTRATGGLPELEAETIDVPVALPATYNLEEPSMLLDTLLNAGSMAALVQAGIPYAARRLTHAWGVNNLPPEQWWELDGTLREMWDAARELIDALAELRVQVRGSLLCALEAEATEATDEEGEDE